MNQTKDEGSTEGGFPGDSRAVGHTFFSILAR